MKPESEKKIAEAFPFMRRKEGLREQYENGFIGDPYGAFGCECGDGWYDLIYSLCAEITAAYRNYNKPIDIEVEQVKEKYGGLRFYYGFTASSPDYAEVHLEVDGIAAKWEKKSEEVCEECGKPGVTRNELPWISTLCDECLAAGSAEK